jgi:hypothetical protein
MAGETLAAAIQRLRQHQESMRDLAATIAAERARPADEPAPSSDTEPEEAGR